MRTGWKIRPRSKTAILSIKIQFNSILSSLPQVTLLLATTAGSLTDPEKKEELDWTHPQEACLQHHRAGPDLQSTGEEQERKSQKRMLKGHRGRNAEKWSFLDDMEKAAKSPVCWQSLDSSLWSS